MPDYYAPHKQSEEDQKFMSELLSSDISNLVHLADAKKANLWVPHFGRKNIRPNSALYDVNYLLDCIEDVHKWNRQRYGKQNPNVLLTIDLLNEEGKELKEALNVLAGKRADEYRLKELADVLDAYGDLTFVYYGFISRMLKNGEDFPELYHIQRDRYVPLIKSLYKTILLEFIEFPLTEELGQFCMAYHTEILCAVCTSNNTKTVSYSTADEKVNSGPKGKGKKFKEPDFSKILRFWKPFENLIGRY